MLALALLAVALVPIQVERRLDAEASPTTPTPTGRALVIGCSEYPHLRALVPERYESEVRLEGPENDAALMREVLVESLGFEAAQVEVLAGWPDEPERRPTRANIEAGLERLAARAEEGDFVVVYFAGHGAQVAAGRDAFERDGLDEALLPADVGARTADGAQVGEAPLRDHELREHLDEIRRGGARVWMVVDACHSGSLLRGGVAVDHARARARFLDLDLIGEAPARDANGDATLRRFEGLEGVVVFHAAQADGSAPEYPIPVGERGPVGEPGPAGEGIPSGEPVPTGNEVRWHGLFTWLLARELTRTNGHIAFDDLLTRLVGGYQAWPCNLALPGASGDFRGTRVIDGASVEREAQLTRVGASLTLDRGRLWGTSVGATWEVLSERGEVLTEFVVTRAGLSHSNGYAAEHQALVGADAWTARWKSERLDARRATWALVDPDGRPLEPSIDPQLELHASSAAFTSRFERVAPEDADWLAVYDHGRYRLRPHPSIGGSDQFLRGVRELGPRLEALSRWSNLVRLSESGTCAPLPDGLSIEVSVRAGDDAPERALVAGARVAPGTQVQVRARVEQGRSVDLFLFYADALGRLYQLFPDPLAGGSDQEERESPRLTDDTVLYGWQGFTDDPLGIERLLVLAVPVNGDEPLLDLWALRRSWPSTTRSAATYGTEDVDGEVADEAIDPLSAFVLDLAAGRATRSGGGARRASARALGALVFPIELAWPALARPRFVGRDATPASEAADAHAPAGLPDPLAGMRREVLLGPLALGPGRSLVAEGRERVERVLLDMDANGSVPSAAFVYADDGNYAYYRWRPAQGDSDRIWGLRRDGRVFDRVLVDRDRDGVAEEFWSYGDGGWVRETGVRTEWLCSRWFLARAESGFAGAREDADLARVLRAFAVLGGAGG